MKLGRHIPTSSRPVQAAEIAQSLGCDAIQIFVNNPTAWQRPAGDQSERSGEARRSDKPDVASAFARAAAERGLTPVVVHAPYLINLASPDESIFDKSVILLGETIQRARRFGARYVVFHIGSHRGAGVAAGIKRIAAGLRRILPEVPDGLTVLLENDVGAGQEVGNTIEHLAAALDALPEHAERLGSCLDTAHLWGAGYPIGQVEEVERLLADFDRLIGLQRLPVIHLNDTPQALGSHRDYHARIGEGVIPEEGLRALLGYPALGEATIILETPIQTLANDHDRPDWAHEQTYFARVRALVTAAIGEGQRRSAEGTPALRSASHL